MRWLFRLVLAISTLATGALSLWLLAQNPFAQPFVERSAAQAKVKLAAILAQTVDSDWAEERVSYAIATENFDELTITMDLAESHGVIMDPQITEQAEAFVAAENGFLNQAGECAACANDVSNCKRLAQIASCAVPVELSPVGDLNALRRAGVDWASGEDVDKLEVGLALAGLGATGLTVATGGTSYSIKAGASLYRVAHRLNALTPPFSGVLLSMADIAIEWDNVPDYLLGRVSMDEVADAAKIAAMGDLAQDLDRVRVNTSAAEVLTLLKNVDSPQDAKTLARLAEAQGAQTRHTLSALGKSRTFRMMYRLSDIAILTVGMITAFALQLFYLLAAFAQRRLFRARR